MSRLDWVRLPFNDVFVFIVPSFFSLPLTIINESKTSENFQANKDSLACASWELKFCVCWCHFFYFVRWWKIKRENIFNSKNKNLYSFIPSIIFQKNWNSKWIFIRKQSESVLPTQNVSLYLSLPSDSPEKKMKKNLQPIHYRMLKLTLSLSYSLLSSSKRDNMWQQENVYFPALKELCCFRFPSSR